jgi:hypothetical protein
MLDDILTAISLGRRVLNTVRTLKGDVESFQSNKSEVHKTGLELNALDKRMGDLEMLARQQDERLRELEHSVKDALIATEAVAARAGTIYWMAFAACALSVPALILSVLSLVLRR